MGTLDDDGWSRQIEDDQVENWSREFQFFNTFLFTGHGVYDWPNSASIWESRMSAVTAMWVCIQIEKSPLVLIL